MKFKLYRNSDFLLNIFATSLMSSKLKELRTDGPDNLKNIRLVFLSLIYLHNADAKIAV